MGIERATALAERAIDALSKVAIDAGWPTDRLPGDAAGLLTMRSAMTGWTPSGARSASGSARLVRAADGWIAVNLPRPDDLDLVPAWLGTADPGLRADQRADAVPWDAIEVAIAARASVDVVERGQLVGLAIAAVPEPGGDPDVQLVARGTLDPARPFVRTHAAVGSAGPVPRRPRVVDLSSLWAGPLCARLLTDLGAEVVKVESDTRPDGARRGPADFYRWLHAGQQSVVLPWSTTEGRAELRDLLASADVVIEGSRPRALDALGIDPHAVVGRRPGSVWLAVTAYGRTGPWRNRVGFGDDAAAAGGLVGRPDAGAPSFTGDAVADPLTGIVGAWLVADALARGGGVVLDVALREVARAAAAGAEVVA